MKIPLLVAGGAMAAGTTYMYQTDEGFRRTLIFWYNAMPPFLEYKVTEAKMKLFKWDDETSTREFNILHEKWSPVTEELCLRMKGYYLKNAQLMSTQDHFVPKQYLKWMKKTQNEVPTVLKDGEWREIFEKSTGKKCSDVFEWWDDKPLGIASIGEVHRARLKGGKEVVIKIQAPGIERVFRNDMKQVKRFCELGLPQFVPALDEIEKQFMTEFDYVGEATNLDRICNNIMPVWGHKVAIPRPVMPLCTKDVLVMDFLSGKRLVDGIRDQYSRYAKKMGMTLEELETKYRKDIKPVTIEEQRRQNNYQEQLIVVGDILFSLNWSRFIYNMSPLRWVAGPMKYEWTEKPINLGEIMQTLLDVHAWEILIDGAFNGDPHPGNILLMDDGRLGLIDYGQVKILDKSSRLKYAKMILALERDDKEEVHRINKEEFGAVSKYNNKEVGYKLVAFWNDRDTNDITGGKNIAQFLDECEAIDPVLKIPEETVLAARVSIMMRGMGNAFGMKLRVAPYWAPFAEKALRDAGIPVTANGNGTVVPYKYEKYQYPKSLAK